MITPRAAATSGYVMILSGLALLFTFWNQRSWPAWVGVGLTCAGLGMTWRARAGE